MARLVDYRELVDRGFGSRVTIWRAIRAGRFPSPPVNLGSEERPKPRWPEDVIDQFMAALRDGLPAAEAVASITEGGR